MVPASSLDLKVAITSSRSLARAPPALLGLLPNKPPSPASKGPEAGGELGHDALTQGHSPLTAGRGEVVWSPLWQQGGGDSTAQSLSLFVYSLHVYAGPAVLLGSGAKRKSDREAHVTPRELPEEWGDRHTGGDHAGR